MKIISNLVIITIVLTACLSSKIKKGINNEQIIEYKTQFYDTVGNQFSQPRMIFKERIWYKDSMAIESVSTHNVVTNERNETTEGLIVKHYRFSDLRKKSVYEYKTFSDTAEILRKYSYDDTVQILSGWNFKWVRKIDHNGIPKNLTDTIIDNISYKRVSLTTGTATHPFEMICYFRCDKKGTVFTLDKNISEMVGCPMVKLYSFSLSKKGRASSTEVNFLADEFTKNELRVFDAWEKNIKKYPVNK